MEVKVDRYNSKASPEQLKDCEEFLLKVRSMIFEKGFAPLNLTALKDHVQEWLGLMTMMFSPVKPDVEEDNYFSEPFEDDILS